MEIIGGAGGAANRRCLYFSSTPPCSVSHLSESWCGRERKHWVSEEENAVGIKDAILCKVEWWYEVLAVFVYSEALKTLCIR